MCEVMGFFNQVDLYNEYSTVIPVVLTSHIIPRTAEGMKDSTPSRLLPDLLVPNLPPTFPSAIDQISANDPNSKSQILLLIMVVTALRPAPRSHQARSYCGRITTTQTLSLSQHLQKNDLPLFP